MIASTFRTSVSPDSPLVENTSSALQRDACTTEGAVVFHPFQAFEKRQNSLNHLSTAFVPLTLRSGETGMQLFAGLRGYASGKENWL